jgi:hypothetical protein
MLVPGRQRTMVEELLFDFKGHKLYYLLSGRICQVRL